MHTKRIWIPVLAISLAIITYLGTSCEQLSICDGRGISYALSLGLFAPVLIYTLFLLPIALLVIFVSNSVYRALRHFSIWFVPISAIIAALQPAVSGSWIPMPARFVTAGLLGAIYLLISAVIVIVQIARTRKKKRP